jgi:hypothetical protein
MKTDTSTSPSRSLDSQAEPPRLGEYNGFEVYPMPFFATLTAGEPEVLGRWYQRALGFDVMLSGPLTHLRRRRYQDLLVVRGVSSAPEVGPVLRFDADGELDELASRARGEPPVGRSSIEGPVDTPWNTRELSVTDPEGYRFIFSARRATPDAAVEARTKALLDAGRRREGQ